MSNTVVTNGIRVLIIDDDEDILQILGKILEKKGFIIDTADTGQKAIDKLAAKTYAVALIDVVLKDMNGLDLLKQIQEIAPNMRKIILTGYPSDEDREEALARGAEHYLAKPVDAETLITIIRDKTEKIQATDI